MHCLQAKKEREAAEERGPPPEASHQFRLPAALVPDMLSVWELLQVRGILLHLPVVLVPALCGSLLPEVRILKDVLLLLDTWSAGRCRVPCHITAGTVTRADIHAEICTYILLCCCCSRSAD